MITLDSEFWKKANLKDENFFVEIALALYFSKRVSISQASNIAKISKDEFKLLIKEKSNLNQISSKDFDKDNIEVTINIKDKRLRFLNALKKLRGTSIFSAIEDPVKWQVDLRNEWK